MEKSQFECVLEGVVISVESDNLTLEQAKEMLVAAYPDRKLDIYRGLKRVIRPDSVA